MSDYKWDGSPYSSPFDEARCAEAVWPSGRGAIRDHQCFRKATVGRYCRQHSQEEKAKRAAARKEKRAQKSRQWKLQDAAPDLFEYVRDMAASGDARAQGIIKRIEGTE